MKLDHIPLKKVFLLVACLGLFFVLNAVPCAADDNSLDDDDYLDESAESGISDPLEPMNRTFFHFNDKLYFWVLKPVATGYKNVLAEDVRMCVRDFFNNLLAPVRIVNNLLQGKIENTGVESARFLINTTVGIGGLADPAKNEFGLTPKQEDFGQTLGTYGLGDGIYFCWPIFGPSSARDTVGLVGDAFLSPLTYLTASDTLAGVGAQSGEKVNKTSLTLGDYEDFKAAAIDPYIAIRDAYVQYRRHKVQDSGDQKSIYSQKKYGSRYVHRTPSPITEEELSVEKANDFEAFYVQVGTAVEPNGAFALQEKLLSVDREAFIRAYDRGSYVFYGVQVPAGEDFFAAKEKEEQLYAAGFTESRLIQ